MGQGPLAEAPEGRRRRSRGCPSDSPLHWIVAHTLAPIAAVIVLTAPLAALLARWTRRG